MKPETFTAFYSTRDIGKMILLYEEDSMGNVYFSMKCGATTYYFIFNYIHIVQN